jgi:hypothetical protein
MTLVKHAAVIMLSLAPAWAFGQAASEVESSAVADIAQCIVQNAPDDWSRLIMVVHLQQAGAETGQVRYVAARTSSEEPVDYVPCDRSRPARILLDARSGQPPEKRGWTTARLVLRRDGQFSLNYDYP